MTLAQPLRGGPSPIGRAAALVLTPFVIAVAALANAGCSGSEEAGADENRADSAAAGQDAAIGTEDSGSPDTSSAFDAGSAFDIDGDDANWSDATTDTAVVKILGPPYPIVLAHGFFGFDKFAGLNFATYFYKVVPHLQSKGEKHVYTPAVDPFNSSTVRGTQLIKRIEAILAKTGHSKVNIIGHSQGGLDARVVASLRPDLVASVTTYATPNLGSPIADMAMKLLPTKELQKLLDALTKAIGAPVYDKGGKASSVVEGIKQFTKEGIAAFNKKYPNDDAVAYFSVTGRTGNMFGGSACKPDKEVAFIKDFALVVDPVDVLFAVQEALIDGTLTAPIVNDGMVQVKSGRWGTFLGCVPADHMDEVGHLLGDKPGLFNPWNHLVFFDKYVGWLRSQGH